MFEPIALCAHLGRVAQLARETGALCEDVVERALVRLQCAGQMGALTGVGVLLASESPSGLGQLREPLGELLALG